MKKIKKVLNLVIIYIILTSVFGIIRSNIVFSELAVNNDLSGYITYTSVVISSLLAGLFLIIIVYFSWFANVSVDGILSLKKYCEGLIGVIGGLITGEVVKFLYVVFFLKEDLLEFENTTSLLNSIDKIYFVKFASLVDYVSYALGGILFVFIVYNKKNIAQISFIAIVITSFLFFTKYITN